MSPRVEHLAEGVTLYCGDAVDVLWTVGKHGPFGAVITDPPYLMGSASTRAGRGFRSRVGDWANAALWYSLWMERAWNALPAAGSMWVCANWRSLPVLTLAADSFGVAPSSVVVWDKQWIGVGSNKGLRQRYELIVQFGNESFSIEDRSAPDIWAVPWSSRRPNGHESEKPVDLMARAISYAAPGTILDPFMGSGTTGAAAVKAGRPFVGVEIEPRYFDIACRRIADEINAPRLFAEPSATSSREVPAL